MTAGLIYSMKTGLCRLRQISTFVQTLIQSGQLTEKAALTHPYRHVITRAVGIEQFLEVDFFEADWKLGDTLLLCSDGLTNMVSDEEIADIFKHKNSLEDQGSALLGLALEHGGKDNDHRYAWPGRRGGIQNESASFKPISIGRENRVGRDGVYLSVQSAIWRQSKRWR